MPSEYSDSPPLELTIVVEPIEPPGLPPPPAAAPGRPVNDLALATAVAALVFGALSWWAV